MLYSSICSVLVEGAKADCTPENVVYVGVPFLMRLNNGNTTAVLCWKRLVSPRPWRVESLMHLRPGRLTYGIYFKKKTSSPTVYFRSLIGGHRVGLGSESDL